MIRKMDISTPEGYFETLQERLRLIPSRRQHPSVVRRLSPYVAIAASIVLAAVLGNFILKTTAAPSEEDLGWEYISYLTRTESSPPWKQRI